MPCRHAAPPRWRAAAHSHLLHIALLLPLLVGHEVAFHRHGQHLQFPAVRRGVKQCVGASGSC